MKAKCISDQSFVRSADWTSEIALTKRYSHHQWVFLRSAGYSNTSVSIVRKCSSHDSCHSCLDSPVARLHSTDEPHKPAGVWPRHRVLRICASLKSDRICNMVSGICRDHIS